MDKKERIKYLIDLVGAGLSKYQKWLASKFLWNDEPTYISMPRYYGESSQDDGAPFEKICEAFNKLSEASLSATVAMRGISKTWLCMVNQMNHFNKLLREEYEKNHPRVVHLSKHAKKARVRKKNQNRIRRMI